MKIKDLIEKLQKFDPNKSVVCYCEDEGLISDSGPIQVLEIMEVSENEAESSRLNNGEGKPCLKFGSSKHSSKYVLIEITSDV
ncbi:MAG: hypothetical protein JAZ12_12785 [Candidatus Thiodiazotropha taylori]|nr:hypothetical protein [Candidatus Thiodiazotropha taylori]